MRRIKTLITAFLALITSIAVPAAAGCLQDGGTLRESLNCLGLPSIPKYSSPKVFVWDNGTEQPRKDILAVNDGNELLLWNVTNPSNPVFIAQSNFNIANQGDSDYDLVAYSVCEGCRYGVASFKRGTVIWDLGTGNNPSFGQRTFYLESNPSKVCFTYKSGDSQYAISADLPGGIGGTFDHGTIYRIASHSNPIPVNDFVFPTGMQFTAPVSGGFDRGDSLLLGINGGIYNYAKSGNNLIYVSNTGMKAYMGGVDSIGIFDNLAVTAERGNTQATSGLKLWDISNLQHATMLHKVSGKYRTVAFSGTFVVTADNGDDPLTFKVQAGQLVPLDVQFWNPGNPWNSWPVMCTFSSGAAFSFTGDFAFLARWSVLQKIDFRACGGSTPTPTPTPPPWPTPRPTCVPGCVPG